MVRLAKAGATSGGGKEVDPKSDDSSEQQHSVVYYREQNGKGALNAYYAADLKLVAQEAA